MFAVVRIQVNSEYTEYRSNFLNITRIWNIYLYTENGKSETCFKNSGMKLVSKGDHNLSSSGAIRLFDLLRVLATVEKK